MTLLSSLPLALALVAVALSAVRGRLAAARLVPVRVTSRGSRARTDA